MKTAMSKTEIVGLRLNVLIRVSGLLFFVLGLVLAYFTSTAMIAPQATPIFYAGSASLCVAGLIALAVKLE